MKKIIILLILLSVYRISIATDLITYDETLPENKELSYEQVLSIFTRKQKFWKNGHKITVFIKPINSIEHQVFITDWLGISIYRYKRILKKEIYSGRTNNVKEVLSDGEMIRSVLLTPYSIGYLTDGTLLYALSSVEEQNNIAIIYYD